MNRTPYLSNEVADIVLKDYLASSSTLESTAFQRLSPRECKVLQLIAEGKTTAKIAQSLHISVKTVETHRKQIMEKLNLKTVAELTKYAIREGLTTA